MGQQLSSEEITEKCVKDLKLSSTLLRMEENNKNGDGYMSPCTVQILTHEDWLASLCRGAPTAVGRSDFSEEEADLYLQHSCSLSPPHPWRILSIQIIPKGDNCDTRFPTSLPQPKSSIPTESMWDFFSHIAYHNQHLSWTKFVQNIDCLNDLKVPLPKLTTELFRDLVKKLYDTSVVVLSSESPQETSGADSESSQAVEVKLHPNLSPLIAAVESDSAFYLVYHQEKFTLLDLMLHTPAVLDGQETKLQFIVYQLLRCLDHLHLKGITMGEVGLRDVHVDNCLWIHLRTPHCGIASGRVRSDEEELKQKELTENATVQEEASPEKEYLWGSVPSLPVGEAFLLWRKGELTNFDYLMILNYAAGRRMEDSNNHPILPWVSDFSISHGGWRDLTKTKHLLSKGDRQLDFGYHGAKEENRLHPESAVVPHHIGDLLTDVTYYMYMARKTPREVLCSRVRRNWVPEEYPTSMEHMFKWTPDECIPEFYCDPSVFDSIHNDLPDLAIPSWATSPGDFVQHHKAMLESDHVSAHIHHWIDLVFGYKLTGEPAVKARNIHLALEDRHTNLIPYGVVQLFKSPHPRRLIDSQCSPYMVKNPDYEPLPSLGEEQKDESLVSDPGREKPSPLTKEENTDKTDDSSQVQLEKTPSNSNRDKLVFKDVDLEDTQTRKLSPFNQALDDSFEDLTTVANDNEVSKSMDDVDFGPASFSHIPGVIDQSTQLLQQNTTKNRSIPKALVGVLRRDRNPQEPEGEGFQWTGEQVMSPFDFHPTTQLHRLAELGSFWQKNFKTKPKGGIFAENWTSQELFSFTGLETSQDSSNSTRACSYFWERNTALSFEEEVRKDIVAVTCVTAELFLFKYLKTTLQGNMSLSERVAHLKAFLETGHWRLPYFVSSLVEYVFAELQDASETSSLGLPRHSVPILLQQHIPVFAYPVYFEQIYDFLGGLHLLKQELTSQPSNSGNAEVECLMHESCMKTLGYISKFWTDLVCAVDIQGLEILLLHLTSVFKLPLVSIEMVCTVFHEITSYLNCSLVTSHFLHLVQTLYDTPTQPYIYGLILHRPFLHTLISRFGLKNFIRYFLVYVREAVLDPSSARFPYLHQRPESLLDSKPKPINRSRSPQEPGESFPYKMTVSEGRHPSTPPPSPINEEFDVEEDEEQDEKEENVYEEYSLLLHPQTKDSSSMQNSQKDESKEDSVTPGLAGLTPFELLTQEPLFVARSSSTDDPNFASKLAMSLSFISPQQTGTDKLSSDPRSTAQDSIPIPAEDNSHVRPLSPLLTTDYEKANQSTRDPSTTLVHDSSVESDSVEEKKLTQEEAPLERVDTEMKDACNFLSRVALDSLQWLVQLLSPVMVTRHIVQPLLEGLPRSFTSCIRGSVAGVPAVEILLHVAQLYGDDVILKLYLPQIQKWLQPIENQQYTQKSESGLAAAISLLNVCMQALDKSTVEHNITFLASEYFHPLVHFTMSTGVVFTLGQEGRSFICQSVLQLLLSACDILGREKAYEISHLQTAIQIFFSRFEEVLSDFDTSLPSSSLAVAKISSTPTVPEYKKEVVEQLKQVLTPSFLQYAYVQFCHKIGQLKLKDWLYNIETIEQIVLVDGVDDTGKEFEDSVIVQLHNKLSNKMDVHSDDDSDDDEVDVNRFHLTHSYGPLQAFTESCGLLGESASAETALWFVPLEEDEEKGEDYLARKLRQAEAEFLSRYQVASEQLNLSIAKGEPVLNGMESISPNEHKLIGSWSTLWGSELNTLEGMREQPLVFSNLRLQTYSGHRGPISKLTVIHDESAFLSASRDKTIKLWSLSNHDNRSDVTQCGLTYTSHQKTILGVEYVPVLHQVASCGSSLHIWNPDTGYSIREYLPKLNHSFLSLVTVATPFPVVVMGTLDGHLQLFDLRMKDCAHWWRLNADITSSATLKKLAADENSTWIAGTFTGGTVHTLDPRTGEILKYWKTVDNPVFSQEITAIRGSKRGHLIGSTSSGIFMWSSKGEMLQSRKDSSQVVQNFEVLDDQLIGVSSGNQLIFYNNIETQLSRAPRSVKVHAKTLKGTLVNCVPLKHNHTLLLGTDSGQIVLSV